MCTPAGPAIPVLSGHLLQATALSGNYYLGDKYGDKAVLACKMYEVCRHWERCTWPGNEWCEGASAAHEPPFSPCLVKLIAADHHTDMRRSSVGIIGLYLLLRLKYLYLRRAGRTVCFTFSHVETSGVLDSKGTILVQLGSPLIPEISKEFQRVGRNLKI